MKGHMYNFNTAYTESCLRHPECFQCWQLGQQLGRGHTIINILKFNGKSFITPLQLF